MKKLLSVSVMAHPKRKEWAEQLSQEVGAPIYFDTDNTIWHTCKGAWSLYDEEAKYHLVVQDDSVLCDNFMQEAEAFIRRIESLYGEDNAFYFYFGNHNGFPTVEAERLAKQNGFLKKEWGMNGVAIAMRTNRIKGMIKFGDIHSAWQDDEKIASYLKHEGMSAFVPIPTLVDHRRKMENPSIVSAGRKELDRYSPWFKGKGIQDMQPEVQNQAVLNENSIPRVIHQIWIRDRSLIPMRFIEGWHLPGFQHKLWTEIEIDAFFKEFPDNEAAYRFYYKQKLWHGASDIIRYEILKQFGGWYIDADERRIAAPEDFEQLFIDTDFFAVEENQYGLVANGILASKPHHPIMEEWSDRIAQLPCTKDGLYPAWKKLGCVMLTDILKGNTDPRVKILPQYSFLPVNAQKEVAPKVGMNYGEQFWASTHNLYGRIGIRDQSVGYHGARGIRRY